ncbi:hypothetical protein F7725_019937 [Dissostichus mawsoni]|uniref:Solute carrier family 22 member 2 n=1 Tax=Dissostichus mawsoni TaxID=36200 RepID=A0A7J5YPM3_DISMA|nr:hypothetical protein F7725_019937 [Dissostichus mawsoni]
MTTFDDILEEAGKFGRCQKRIFALFCLVSMPWAGVYVGIVFQGFTPDHWCRDPAVLERRQTCGWSLTEARRLTVPQGNRSESSCERYEVDWNSTALSCDSEELDLSRIPTTAACKDGWEYDYEGRQSFVTEVNGWLVDLYQATLNVGFLVGSIAIGYLADRFGRKISFLMSNVLNAVTGIMVAVAPNYVTLLVFRTLYGFGVKGGWVAGYKQNAKAVKITQAMAKENKKTLSKNIETLTDDNAESRTASFMDLIRTPKMRKHTLILSFNCAVVYQGLIMRLGILGGNVYIDFLISGLVEFPAAFLILFTIERIGRRIPFASANIVAGAACLITAMIPDSMFWFKTVVACIGRMGITMAFEMVMFVNTELYPTFVRNFGVSVCSTLCDVGGIVAPFLLYRLAVIWLELPLLIFGLPLPDTIDDIEHPERRMEKAALRNQQQTNLLPTEYISNNKETATV